MDDVSALFLAKYSQLPPTKTIAETRRQFFQLLHEFAHLKQHPQQLDNIAASLNPQNCLEQHFKVDFLIYFHCSSQLYEILKEGNDIFVCKIMKETWFFQENFNGNPQELVNTILPNLSYSVRMKVLNKLSKIFDGEHFDEIFDAVTQRYGSFIALKYLSACSAAKIKYCLENLNLTENNFKTPQLMKMYAKDAQLIDLFYEKVKTISNRNNLELLKHIFKTNNVFFDQLVSKYFLSVEFGKRLSKKYVNYHKEEIIAEPAKYYNKLNMKAVTRKLGADNVRLFHNILPEKLTKYNLWCKCDIFAQKYHYSLYVKAFEKHYNIKIEENPDYITKQVLDIVPTVEERIKLAKIKLNVTANEDYISYLSLDEAIPLLKSKINVSAVAMQRSILIKQLVKTCALNKNMDELTNVMQYFLTRHKNDEDTVYSQFLSGIKSFFNYKDFDETKWKILSDLYLLLEIKKKETIPDVLKLREMPIILSSETSSEEILYYFEFLYKNGKLPANFVEEFFKCMYTFNSFKKHDEQFINYLIKQAIESHDVIRNKFKTDSDKVDYDLYLFRKILEYNKEFPSKQVDLTNLPIYASFLSELQQEDSCLARVHQKYFKDKIFTLEPNPLREEYLKMYWTVVKSYQRLFSLKDLKWFLKYEPQQVHTNCETIMDNLRFIRKRDLKFLLPQIKKMSKWQLDTSILDYCKKEVLNESPKTYKFVYIMSFLMTPEEFLAFAETNKPIDAEVDMTDPEVFKAYKLKTSIAANLKNLNTPKALSVVLQYCLRDYFKFAQCSLYSLVSKTPETQLHHVFDQLIDKPVSLRKHLIFFAIEFLSVNELQKILELVCNSEKNKSIQKYLFAAALKYLKKNPSEQFFEFVKKVIKFIQKDDEESLTLIANGAYGIDPMYRSEYIKYSWEFMDAVYPSDKLKKFEHQNQLFFALNIKEEGIDFDFGWKIFSEHFLIEGSFIEQYRFNNQFFDFVYVNHEKSDEFLKLIFERIQNCAKPESVSKHFHVWQRKILSLKIVYRFVQTWSDFWPDRITSIDNFDMYVGFFALQAKLEMTKSNNVLLTFAEALNGFIEILMAKFGPFVMEIFVNEFFKSLQQLKNELPADFYFELIRLYPTLYMHTFLAVLLRHHNLENQKLKDALLDKLRSFEHAGFRIMLNSHFGK